MILVYTYKDPDTNETMADYGIRESNSSTVLLQQVPINEIGAKWHPNIGWYLLEDGEHHPDIKKAYD